MALEVPEAFLAERRTSISKKKPESPPAPAVAEERLFRLAAHHLEDLRVVARGEEETDAGLRCSAFVDAASGEGRDFDEYALTDVERFADRSLRAVPVDFSSSSVGVRSWRERVLRARRAIRRLYVSGDARSASVLFVAYGYPDPLARQYPELVSMGAGLGSLARYADAVEAVRLELVRAETSRLVARGARTGDRYREGGDLRALAERDGYDPGEFATLVDLSARREFARWAEKVVTSADALRAALSPFPEPGVRPRWLRGEETATYVAVTWEGHVAFEARKAARRERETAWRARREAFLLQLRVETLGMLSRAEKAYHDAWLRSAAS